MFGDLWRSLRRGRSERTETHEEEARRRKRKLLRQSLDVETLETREVPAVMLFAVGNVHDLTLVHNGGNYQIVQTSNPLNLLASQAAASVSEVKITGAANAADQLTVNHGPGIVDVPVTFDGGAGGGDELTLKGFSFTTVTHQMTGPGAETVDQDGRVVTTIGVERTVDALPTAARSFQLPATNDLVAIDGGAVSGDGVSRLSSPNTVPTIDFAAPQQMLTVDGGLGADWFELKAVDFTGAAPRLRLNGGDGDDTFQVAAESSLPNTLTLDGGAGLNNGQVEKTHIDDTKGDGLVGTHLQSLLVTGGSMNGNRGHGILLDTVSAFSAIDVTCDANLGGGLSAQHGETASIVGGSYSANWGAGLDLLDISRSVELQGVTANGNIKGGVGLRATNVGSLSDSSGSYLQNADGGIVAMDVAGDVMLTGTTADDNDADFSGVGDGFAAKSSGGKHEWPSEGDVGGNAIGGRLTITGGSFSRTFSPETHQVRGIYVESVAGGADFFDGEKQALTVQNNELQGVTLVRAGSHALFVGGSYSFNHDTGIALTRVDGDLSLDAVSALANGGDGLRAWPDGQSTVAGQISVNNSQFSYNSGSGFFIHEAGSTGAKIVDSQFNKNGDTNLILRYVNGVVDFDHVSAIGSQSGFGAALHLSTSGQFHDTDGDYSQNPMAGLHLFDTGDVTLTRTIADGNGGRGVEADDGIKGDLVADGVRLRNNGSDGMSVFTASSVELQASTGIATEVTGNGGSGLFVGDGGSHAAISGGSFSYNGGDNVRIGVVDDAVTIVGATLDGSVTGNGLNLPSAGSLSVINSEFSNNFADGIQFEKLLGDLSLTSVVANGNGGSGAYTWADNNMAVGGQISVVGTTMNFNGDSGLFLHGLGGTGTSITQSNFNSNQHSNLVLRYAHGLVDFKHVSAVGSQSGYGAALHLTTNGLFKDTDGIYSSNAMAGLHLFDVGDVTLTRTIADANGGRGVEAEDGIAGALVADGVRLRNNGGDGMWVATADKIDFDTVPGVASEVTGNAGQGLFFINGGSHVTLNGGSFSSNGGDNVHLVHTTGAVTLSNVTLDGSVAGTGLNLLSACSLSIINSELSNNFADGIRFEKLLGNLSLTSVVASDNGGNGAYTWANDNMAVGGQISVVGTTMNFNGDSGLFLHGLGGTGTSITQSNFNSNQHSNLVLRYAHGLVDFKQVSAVGSQSGYGAALHLTANGLFKDTDGIYSSNAMAGLHLFDAGDVTLTRTNADANGGRGVEAEDGITGALVADGVRLRNNGGDGMWVATADKIDFDTVPGVASEVTGNAGRGLFFINGGSHVTLGGGSFSSNGGDNVHLVHTTGAVTLSNVTLDGSVAGTGLNLLSAGSLSIINAEFSNNFADGIQFEKLLGNLSLTSVVASGNGGNGAYTWADDNMAVGGQISIASTTMNFNGDSGLFLHGLGGTGTSIVQSNFNSNQHSNLVLRYAHGLVDFKQVSAVGSQTGYGAALHLTTNGLFKDTDGNYTSNASAGLHLFDAGDVTFTRTIADANGGNGVEADQGIAGALVVQGGRFRNNSGSGASIWHADSVEITDDLLKTTAITGNGGDGLAVTSSSASVSVIGGDYSSNGGDNVRFSVVNGPFTAKNITANGGGRGLYLGTATTATLTGVTLENNSGVGLELFSSAPPVNATAVVQNSSFQGNSIGAKIDGGLTTSVAISSSQFNNNNTKLNANSGGQTGVGLAVLGGIVSVETSQFQQNTVGAQLTEADGSLKITTSIVSGNTSFGVKNLSTTPVDAVFNYWGSGTGPTHASNASGVGDKASNYVEFAPWASSSSFAAATAPKVVGGNLVIGGTSSVDTITVSESSTNFIVTLNGQSSTFLKSTVTDHIVVYAFAGGDTVQVTAAKAAEIHGGAGNDTLTGGAAKDVIWGDDGVDILWSGGGDDVLIGGAGQDELHGAGGKDILLGGDFKTGLRHNDVEAYRYAALKSISSQWVGGLQDSDLTSLADDVVDTEKDSIWGGAAADWILGNLWSGSSPYDVLNDYNPATDKRTSF